MKKILAIIPARSGSKGLREKNIKLLDGKPMMAYTIEAAQNSNIFDDIIVSTDSQKYADIAIKYGAKVPSLRPRYLSEDTSKTHDVIEHTLKELEDIGKEYEYFIILQPTSPLRRDKDIIAALELMIEKNANAIISVCQAEHSPLYMNMLDESISMDDFLAKDVKTRRQEVPTFYRLNGAIYISRVDYFLKYKDLYRENSYAYVMDRISSVDVDDILDFKFAEMLIKDRENKFKK